MSASSLVMGAAGDMRAMADALDKVKGALVQGYAAKSGRTSEEVSALMAAETWFDAADAEAICEAVARPNMRFVPIKTEDQQSVLVLHRSRDLLMRQRTMLLNAIPAHLAEFGIVAPQGPRKVMEMVARLRAAEEPGLPEIARTALLALSAQLDSLDVEIRRLERRLVAWHRTDAASQRLATIPGVGLLTATALVASVPDPAVFKSGRQVAAYLGLAPRQSSSGGK